MKNPALLLSLCICPSLVIKAAPHEHINHEAHVHGQATLDVVLENDELAIGFASPAANIVGFEHQPKNARQKKTVADAMEQLKQIDALFLLPADAQCKPGQINVASSLAENEHAHHAEHGHKEHDGHQKEESHSEFTAHYHFRCGQPAALKQIEMAILKTFPGIEHMQVQSISPSGQHKTELSPADKVLEL